MAKRSLWYISALRHNHEWYNETIEKAEAKMSNRDRQKNWKAMYIWDQRNHKFITVWEAIQHGLKPSQVKKRLKRSDDDVKRQMGKINTTRLNVYDPKVETHARLRYAARDQRSAEEQRLGGNIILLKANIVIEKRTPEEQYYYVWPKEIAIDHTKPMKQIMEDLQRHAIQAKTHGDLTRLHIEFIQKVRDEKD